MSPRFIILMHQHILIYVILPFLTFELETTNYGGTGGSYNIEIFDQGRISGILQWGYEQYWNGIIIANWTSDSKTSSQRMGTIPIITECTPFQLTIDEYIDGVQIIYGPNEGLVRSIGFHISNGNLYECSIGTTAYNNVANKKNTGLIDISDIYLTGFKVHFGGVIDGIAFQFKDRNAMITVTDMFGGNGGNIINEVDKGRINAIYQWGYSNRYNGIIITNWTSDDSTLPLDELGNDYTGYCTGFVVADNQYIDGYRVKYDGYVQYLAFHISDGSSYFCEVLPIQTGLTDTGWITVTPTSYLTGIWSRTGAIIDQIVLQFTDILLIPTNSPSVSPTNNPSNMPSISPTFLPSMIPTISPSNNPTSPSNIPTVIPTYNPSKSPSNTPSKTPSNDPSKSPSNDPTRSPSNNPSKSPSNDPSKSPSNDPSESPSKSPSNDPSKSPSKSPSNDPSKSPSNNPSISPTDDPTRSPTNDPISGGDGKVDDQTTTLLLHNTDNVVAEKKEKSFIAANKMMINVIISCLVGGLLCCCICITYLYIKQSKKRNHGKKTNVEMEKLEPVKSVSGTIDFPNVVTNTNKEYAVNEGGKTQIGACITDNGDNINNLINNNNHQTITPQMPPMLNTMYMDGAEPENGHIDDEEEEENDDLWVNSNVMTKGGEMNEIVTKKDDDDVLNKKTNNKQTTAGNI